MFSVDEETGYSMAQLRNKAEAKRRFIKEKQSFVKAKKRRK